MLVTISIILFLAILLAPILLIRFRKRWVAAFNLAVTNRITSRFADRLPGFGILTRVGQEEDDVSCRSEEDCCRSTSEMGKGKGC
jgi:hypothetical protein